MGKLRSFQINLDNAQGIFWSGQTVSGRATVDLESEMKMRGIHLHTMRQISSTHASVFHTVRETKKKLAGV